MLTGFVFYGSAPDLNYTAFPNPAAEAAEADLIRNHEIKLTNDDILFPTNLESKLYVIERIRALDAIYTYVGIWRRRGVSPRVQRVAGPSGVGAWFKNSRVDDASILCAVLDALFTAVWEEYDKADAFDTRTISKIYADIQDLRVTGKIIGAEPISISSILDHWKNSNPSLLPRRGLGSEGRRASCSITAPESPGYNFIAATISVVQSTEALCQFWRVFISDSTEVLKQVKHSERNYSYDALVSESEAALAQRQREDEQRREAESKAMAQAQAQADEKRRRDEATARSVRDAQELRDLPDQTRRQSAMPSPTGFDVGGVEASSARDMTAPRDPPTRIKELERRVSELERQVFELRQSKRSKSVDHQPPSDPRGSLSFSVTLMIVVMIILIMIASGLLFYIYILPQINQFSMQSNNMQTSVVQTFEPPRSVSSAFDNQGSPPPQDSKIERVKVDIGKLFEVALNIRATASKFPIKNQDPNTQVSINLFRSYADRVEKTSIDVCSDIGATARQHGEYGNWLCETASQ